MVFVRTNRSGFVISFAAALVLSHVGATSSQAQDPVLGELELQGESIVRLILRREGNNQTETFRRPEQIIKLPAGNYNVQEVYLEEGYIYHASRDPRLRRVTVTSDEPATLKIGGPLKQTVKVNRDRRVLLILIPLVIVNLLWLAFKKVSGMPSATASQFDTVFHSMAVGIAVLWLIEDYLDRFGGFVRFLVFFGTLVAVSCLGILSYTTELSDEAALFLALLVFFSITVLGATTAAGRLCKGRYRPLRFMLWLAFWTIVASVFTMHGFYVVGNLVMSSGSSAPYNLEAILMITFVGLAFGLCLYVLNLPFMILGFTNPFFRKRFNTCLRLQLMPTTAEAD